MAEAKIEETLSVDPDKLFHAITRYEDYPKFVEGVSAAKVKERAPGRTVVEYTVNIMKEIRYTLEHREDAKARTVAWKLVESDFFKHNEGHWKLSPAAGGKTEVEYGIEAEFKISVPGFILKRLIAGQLPAMLKAFETQAKKG